MKMGIPFPTRLKEAARKVRIYLKVLSVKDPNNSRNLARRLRVSAPAPGEATLVKKSPRLNYECCPAPAVKHHTKLLLKEILDEENVRDEGWQLAAGGWRLCRAQFSCNHENCTPAIV